MRKPHLFTSETPWTDWGIQLKALCGKEIPDATWLAGVDTYSEMSIETINLCENCKKTRLSVYWNTNKELAARCRLLRWEYVITEGQEAINAEVSA